MPASSRAQGAFYDREQFPDSYITSVWQNIRPFVRGKAVDVGGNDGKLLAPYAGPVKIVLDLTPGKLREARGRGCQPVQGDMLSLPFASASLDTVILNNAFEHTPTPFETLEELKRVLRPGGRLILDLPNARSLRQLLNLFLRSDPLPAGNSIEFSRQPNHYFQYTSRQLEFLLRQAGFTRYRIFGKKPVTFPFSLLFAALGEGFNRACSTDLIVVAEK